MNRVPKHKHKLGELEGARKCAIRTVAENLREPKSSGGSFPRIGAEGPGRLVPPTPQVLFQSAGEHPHNVIFSWVLLLKLCLRTDYSFAHAPRYLVM